MEMAQNKIILNYLLLMNCSNQTFATLSGLVIDTTTLHSNVNELFLILSFKFIYLFSSASVTRLLKTVGTFIDPTSPME